MQTELVIFKEAFFARLLPIFQEVRLTAEQNFHADAYQSHVLVAGLGALLAAAALYLFGIWLRRIPAKVSTPEQHARIEKMRPVATHWLPWLLILSPTPIGPAIIMAAGFFRVRPLVAAAMILVAEIAWRASPLLKG